MKNSSKLMVASLAPGALHRSACGGADGGGSDANGTSGSNGEAASGGGTLKFYTDKAAWEPQFDRVSDASEEQIGYDLDFTGYSEADAYSAFIKQSFRTTEKPSLFTWHTGDALAELVDEGMVAQTSDLWAEAMASGDIPEDLEQYYTYNGEQYCVPLHVVYWVIYYNKHVFDEHGLDVPETWDDLMEIADTLAGEGVPAFYQTNILFSFVWFQTLLAGSDPDLYEALATGEASYTDPGVVAVMEQWRDMIEAGYFTAPDSADDPQILLNNGDVAMLNFGTFFTGALNEIGMESGEDYDFFVVPNVDPSLPQTSLIVESGPLCAAEEADDRADAMEYMSWWVTAEAQTEWANARGDVSYNPNAEVRDERLADLGEQAGTDDIRLIERYFEATPQPILTAALDGFGAFVTNPGDPMPILEAIQAEADAYWASQQ
jgi:multiple sugar transport system substrate-binding protein